MRLKDVVETGCFCATTHTTSGCPVFRRGRGRGASCSWTGGGSRTSAGWTPRPRHRRRADVPAPSSAMRPLFRSGPLVTGGRRCCRRLRPHSRPGLRSRVQPGARAVRVGCSPTCAAIPNSSVGIDDGESARAGGRVLRVGARLRRRDRSAAGERCVGPGGRRKQRSWPSSLRRPIATSTSAWRTSSRVTRQTLDVDITSVIEACNTPANSHIHQPGIAVGGHCIPVYPRIYLWNDPAATVVPSAREANAAMPEYAIDLLEASMETSPGASVLVLGAAYRGGVKETAFSGVFPTVQALTGARRDAYVADPMYTASRADRRPRPDTARGPASDRGGRPSRPRGVPHARGSPICRQSASWSTAEGSPTPPCGQGSDGS